MHSFVPDVILNGGYVIFLGRTNFITKENLIDQILK